MKQSFVPPAIRRILFPLSGRKGSWVLMFLTLLMLGLGCNEKSQDADTDVEVTPPPRVQVAFAGGGWRAHTAHSAWTMALLQNGSKKLSDVFTNVETVSSNSGGSWFSTMLMFSQPFVDAIQAPDAVAMWDSTGWLGLQRKLFANSGCTNSGDLYFKCALQHYTDPYYWDSVVTQVVYRDFPLTRMNLNAGRQDWAKDKALLLAATLLTSNVVMNEEGLKDAYDKGYYQACLAPATPKMGGYDGSSCQGSPFAADVSPLPFQVFRVTPPLSRLRF